MLRNCMELPLPYISFPLPYISYFCTYFFSSCTYTHILQNLYASKHVYVPVCLNFYLYFLYWCIQGCKRDLSLRDRDIRFLVRDETETFLQFHETETRRLIFATRRDRDRDLAKAETETFFETFNLQDCAKTINGDVQIKTIYTKQYRYLVFYSV